jgi:transcriptional regulator with XRE-family HTH domain
MIYVSADKGKNGGNSMKAREIRFGRNVKALRELHHVTQSQLAEAIHISRQGLSGWEKGEGKPDIYYLDSICEFFSVSADDVLYGDIVPKEEYRTLETSEIEKTATGEEELVNILEEDIIETFPPIAIDFGTIIVIALKLKSLGYEITEVFANGFSVFTRLEEVRRKLKKDIYHIGDCLIHHGNEQMAEKREEVMERIWEIESVIVSETMTEILGRKPEDFLYLWYDEGDNIRGYGDTKEECIEQAKHQACTKFRIMDNI